MNEPRISDSGKQPENQPGADRILPRKVLPRVVLSYGLGVDSTAILLRWIHEPATRPCELSDLLVVTAMTGDEWPQTGDLAERHVLPLLRANSVRYAQVARAGASQAEGIIVLDDSRRPRRLHLGGAYRLRDEMQAAGTVPQTGGARLCSVKAKGWPLDRFITAATEGRPYRHAIGFETGEGRRAARDAACGQPARTPVYPLIEWGWNRRACEDYITAVTGTSWPKSACTYCPYALGSRDGRARVLDRYASDPAAGVAALVMEYTAVALNPAQGLIGGERLAGLLASTGRHREVLRLFDAELDALPWTVYEVRRAFLPHSSDPSRPGRAVRSLRALAHGNRAGAQDELCRIAAQHAVPVDAGDGVPRAWLRRRGPALPAAQWFFAAAPHGPTDKEGPGFAAAWRAALAGPVQLDLLDQKQQRSFKTEQAASR